jgi:hypothetical protein
MMIIGRDMTKERRRSRYPKRKLEMTGRLIIGCSTETGRKPKKQKLRRKGEELLFSKMAVCEDD